MFEHLLNKIETLSELERASEDKISKLKLDIPNLPDDYLEFIKTIGFGNLSDIQLYGEPVPPRYIYGDRLGLESIVLFGDDFQGYCFGFDINDGCRVVEVSPKGEVDKSVEPSFKSLMEGYFS
ncbi:SMI1/KNR4 family protein [Shewanella baltica]|uniref:SMI1/KNR4 family protein n=1 Tax=Shewanella baltica TaxID=62322 RepID=UPI00217D9AE0|nr:SMI1/KNR4 family protein [Shewanella baltica]MCS6180354.1 SMI1/KNR4 family protein [Shewanella baltica]MCS6256569.1 SMI1/KNR4 family protein [Shewanella baltica]